MRTSQPKFTADGLRARINAYFKQLKGKYHYEKKEVKNPGGEPSVTKKRVCDREPIPPTFTGLALFLGFNSLQEFEQYERKGKYLQILKQGRLRIETEYEKKLHLTAASGAIFALKNLGWVEKPEASHPAQPAELNVRIIVTGPQPAATEKDVVLD